MLQMDDAVFDHIAFRDNRRKDLLLVHDGQLHELQLGPVILRTRDHSRIVGIHRQVADDLLEKQFHLVLPGDHDLFHLGDFSILLFHQAVHIEPVPLIGRNPSG